MVDEILHRHTGLPAYLGKHCRTVGIGHIFAVGVYLNYRAASHYRMVGRVELRCVVWMEGMAIVGRYHKRIGNGAVEPFSVVSQTFADAFKHIAQDW